MAKVERVIGYEFGSKDLLKLSLTAAGADSENHDGNRRLAQLGQFVLQLAVADEGFEMTNSRGKLVLDANTWQATKALNQNC